jgi:hypothetical protein
MPLDGNTTSFVVVGSTSNWSRRNTPLEETVKHFDGEQAVLGGSAATEEGLHLASEARFNDTVRMAKEENVGVEVQHVQRVGTGGNLEWVAVRRQNL